MRNERYYLVFRQIVLIIRSDLTDCQLCSICLHVDVWVYGTVSNKYIFVHTI